MNPSISICVPTFNAAKYLKECLNSILAQTFTDFELLIVDNHSSDETISIVKKYAEREPRIRLIRNEHNIGAVRNFNRCIELAQGEWLKYVFADDFIAPDCLELMFAASKPESALICCRRDFLFEPGVKAKSFYRKHLSDWSIDSLFPNKTEISARDFCNVLVDHFQVNIVGEPTAVMLNRNAFYRFGTFNTNLIGICDMELWARIAINTGITYVPKTLATSRLHGGSLTNTNGTNRSYRQSKLDRLVMLHDFAFHPLYAPLREVASHHQPPLNFKDLLAKQGGEARKLAKQSRSNATNLDSSLMQEWKNIIHFYPMLAVLSNPSPFRYSRRVLRKSHNFIPKLKRKLSQIYKSV